MEYLCLASTTCATTTAIGPGRKLAPSQIGYAFKAEPRSVGPSPLNRKYIYFFSICSISSSSSVRLVSTKASPGPITVSFLAMDGIEKNGIERVKPCGVL